MPSMKQVSINIYSGSTFLGLVVATHPENYMLIELFSSYLFNGMKVILLVK
jgi:hypothetical protein